MKKIFLIAWKDLTLAFRDRAALIMMLAAPFLLTLGLGFVTGRFSGQASSGISDIPVIIVNQDGGLLGNGLVDVFQSPELADLVEPTLLNNPYLARQKVDEDQTAAVVIIPDGFTESIIPDQAATTPTSAIDAVQIVVYTNPTRPTSSGVITTIVEEYLNRLEVSRVGGIVAVTQLVYAGLVQVQDAAQIGTEIGMRQAERSLAAPTITVKSTTSEGEVVHFDALALLAPGMALMFLMFTVSNGGRSLLAERAQGTLPRLLVSPTSSTQVLGGKVFGIFLTGVAQMLILIVASAMLFDLQWGNPLAVLALVLAAVFGAVGWGLLITALAKTPGQVGTIGSALMLLFGILGGSFINMNAMHPLFQLVSRITPNSWGLDGFTTLALGGQMADISRNIMALLVMGAVLFTAAVIIFNRRGIAQQ